MAKHDRVELDIGRPRQEFVEHIEAELRIKNLLDGQSGDEGQKSFVGCDGIDKVYLGLLDNGRRQQEVLRGQNMDQCFAYLIQVLLCRCHPTCVMWGTIYLCSITETSV